MYNVIAALIGAVTGGFVTYFYQSYYNRYKEKNNAIRSLLAIRAQVILFLVALDSTINTNGEVKAIANFNYKLLDYIQLHLHDYSFTNAQYEDLYVILNQVLIFHYDPPPEFDKEYCEKAKSRLLDNIKQLERIKNDIEKKRLWF